MSKPESNSFQQRIGLFDATMLVSGTMIGSGIFIVASDMARDVGSAGWLLGLWIVTGIMTLLGALSYAELASMMPRAGGQYVYLKEAYGPLWGFLYGWSAFLVIQCGSIAAVAVAFAKFLGVLIPKLGTGPDAALFTLTGLNWKVGLPLPWLREPLIIFERSEFMITAGQLVAVGIVVLLTLVNCRGVKEGKTIQNLFTVAKIGALLAMILVGVFVASKPEVAWNNWNGAWDFFSQSNPPGKGSRFLSIQALTGAPEFLVMLMVAGGAMVGSLFSADSWNNVTFSSAEVKNPARTVPRSLILGTLLVTTLYLLANLTYLMVLPVQGDEALAGMLKSIPSEDLTLAAQYPNPTQALGISQAKDDRVGTAVMQAASPKLGVPLMAIAIMVSTFGCVNGMVLLGARLYYAMAQDGLFFKQVGQLNRSGVPQAGLLCQAFWSILLIFSGTYSELLDYVIFVALLFYFMTVLGLFVLRFRLPKAERPYRVPGYPILPALYMVLCFLVMVDLLIVRPEFTWPGLIIVLTGVPVYGVWRIIGKPSKPGATG
ncbi:MAG: amino acid permease [Planctomycetota bacterium]|nr:amino acid permease [Planctomycetota bacterium]